MRLRQFTLTGLAIGCLPAEKNAANTQLDVPIAEIENADPPFELPGIRLDKIIEACDLEDGRACRDDEGCDALALRASELRASWEVNGQGQTFQYQYSGFYDGDLHLGIFGHEQFEYDTEEHVYLYDESGNGCELDIYSIRITPIHYFNTRITEEGTTDAYYVRNIEGEVSGNSYIETMTHDRQRRFRTEADDVGFSEEWADGLRVHADFIAD